MKALTFVAISSLLLLSLFASSAFAQNALNDHDHTALVKHYENLAKEAEEKLQENKAVLEEYEAHSFYYGRRGQDLQSHTTANIREYEKLVKENVSNAEHHRKMALEQNGVINKAKLSLDHDSPVVR